MRRRSKRWRAPAAAARRAGSRAGRRRRAVRCRAPRGARKAKRDAEAKAKSRALPRDEPRAASHWVPRPLPVPPLASDRLLAELKTLHPLLIDLSLGRMLRLLAKLGNPQRRLPPGHPYRRHQRQGLDHRLPEGHDRGRGQALPRLHLAASGALSRADLARRRATASRGRSTRTSWSTLLSRVARDQCRRRHHVLRDHDGGGVRRLRRDAGRRDHARSRARRRVRYDQRRRPAGTVRSSRRSRWIMPTSSAAR